MVGNGAVVRPNIAFTKLDPGDLLVACSDGVHKHVEPRDWRRILTGERAMSQRCEDLIGVARANGSDDDATVMLLQRSPIARLPWIHRRAASSGTPK
jgi:serine/threonine protein phosphatase PrpC